MIVIPDEAKSIDQSVSVEAGNPPVDSKQPIISHTKLAVQCRPDYVEMLIAELSEAGFDAFMETPTGFDAFAEGTRFDEDSVEEIWFKYEKFHHGLQFAFERIEQRNWNEEWEKNYHPVNIENKCLVRADFHPSDKKFPYEIILTPKMSFGTGHHPTTYMMIKAQMEINHRGKRVMDAGCGTAILSIMASKLGASVIEAFDVDEWSVENAKENAEVNHCQNIRIQRCAIQESAHEGNV